MGNLFSLAEIVDMGIEKEKKRRDFYAQTAQSFSEKEMNDLFSKLRDWEEAHIKKFNEIRKGIEDSETTESYEGELRDYMNVLLDDQLYQEVSADNFSKKVTDPLSAIQYGISFEKDAILFFSTISDHLGSSSREVIKKLIDEEKQHLIYLTQLRKQYKK